MPDRIVFLDPEVKPPDYRVPRGRSGEGSGSALETLLNDLERIRRAREAYGDLPRSTDQEQFRFCLPPGSKETQARPRGAAPGCG